MTTTTHGSGTALSYDPNRDLSKVPLPLLADQPERWENFGAEGVGFHEAAALILAAAEKDGERVDVGVGDLSTWAFGPHPETAHAALATIPLPGRPRRMIPLREHAFTQLCGRVGAPSQYIGKLPGKLQMACLNHGLRGAKERAGTIRMAGGEARALVSDRYAPLDDNLVLEVLETTLSAAGMLGDVSVRSAAVGRTTALRLTIPSDRVVIGRDAQVGDIVEVGLDLLNGEVGNRSVSITPITWVLTCTNGMRRADREVSARLRHVGDPKRLEEAFRDAVPAALAASQGLRKRMEKAVDRMVDDLLEEFDGLRAFGLSAAETRDVARDVMAQRQVALPENTDAWGDVLAEIRDVNVYDVMNGVTHVAQSRHTDRRLGMEETAAKYLYRRTA
jgi:hypothetical protein